MLFDQLDVQQPSNAASQDAFGCRRILSVRTNPSITFLTIGSQSGEGVCPRLAYELLCCRSRRPRLLCCERAQSRLVSGSHQHTERPSFFCRLGSGSRSKVSGFRSWTSIVAGILSGGGVHSTSNIFRQFVVQEFLGLFSGYRSSACICWFDVLPHWVMVLMFSWSRLLHHGCCSGSGVAERFRLTCRLGKCSGSMAFRRILSLSSHSGYR
jgi:hypothetical protein